MKDAARNPIDRVLVTGANGFVGRHVCEQLTRTGWNAWGLVRRQKQHDNGQSHSIVGNLHDPAALSAALRGTRWVIHLAGRAHVLRESSPDPLLEFRRVNVTGTSVLLDKAINARVSHFIFVSSVAAVTSMSARAVDEDTPEAPDTPYGVSKLEAENVVREKCTRAGIRFTILRPPMVYGPGMKGNPLRLFRAIDRGLPLPLGGIGNRRSSVYVGNLALAIATVLTADGAIDELFLVGDSAPMSSAEFAQKAARALGRKPRLIPVPVPLLRGMAAVADRVGAIIPLPLNSSTVDRLTGSLAVDWSKLRHKAGFEPEWGVDEGLAVTAEWYRNEIAQ